MNANALNLNLDPIRARVKALVDARQAVQVALEVGKSFTERAPLLNREIRAINDLEDYATLDIPALLEHIDALTYRMQNLEGAAILVIEIVVNALTEENPTRRLDTEALEDIESICREALGEV